MELSKYIIPVVAAAVLVYGAIKKVDVFSAFCEGAKEGLMTCAEILPALVLLQEGGSYEQVPVRHFPRTAGKSKYHLWNRLIGPFNDCFAYRWMKPRYINYKVGDDNISTAGSQRLSQTES